MSGFLSSMVGASYAPAVQFVTATGGTISDITIGGVNYRTHRFLDPGATNFVVTAPGLVDILLVGGGSRGQTGSNRGGGGGAGGVLRRNYAVAVTAQTYSITVGLRGQLFVGQGAGSSSTGLGYTATGGLATVGEGSGELEQRGRNNADFNGGTLSNFFGVGAGGAGAGAAGGYVSSSSPSAGGDGAPDSDFTASPTTYGGGGGGAGGNGSEAFGSGGSGGGGRGGSGSYGGAVGGTNGLGAGGGGTNTSAGGAGAYPGEGGNGIVIIRYLRS